MKTRCLGCGRPAPALDAGVVRISRTGETTRIEFERITLCAPPPDGCGTRRVQSETREVRDLGPTTRRCVGPKVPIGDRSKLDSEPLKP